MDGPPAVAASSDSGLVEFSIGLRKAGTNSTETAGGGWPVRDRRCRPPHRHNRERQADMTRDRETKGGTLPADAEADAPISRKPPG
jgi:hypothetical protein